MFSILLESFHWANLLNPQFYVENGGLWLLLFVVFAETGLFIGFFLPGDSLLFIAGIFATKMENGDPGLAYQFLHLIGLGHIKNEWMDLLVLAALISIAGILGNWVGYATGKLLGRKMYDWPDKWLYKKKYLYQAEEFYQKHGSLAIIGARFLPFIRTFAPIIAGIVNMDFKRFFYLNVTGSIFWVCSMLFAGHFLQKWILNLFHFDIRDHLELIIIGIVIVTTTPVILKMLSNKEKK